MRRVSGHGLPGGQLDVRIAGNADVIFWEESMWHAATKKKDNPAYGQPEAAKTELMMVPLDSEKKVGVIREDQRCLSHPHPNPTAENP